jgi:hypothetical protein
MRYVVYDMDTTVKLNDNYYKSEAAAKAAITRSGKDNLSYAETGIFNRVIEKQVQRTNLLTGAVYWERANTPLSCSPASETYWSM